MRFRPLLTAFALLPLAAYLSATGGSMTSSGGERITTEHNPWFVGTRPVTWCVRGDPSFSLDESAAASVFEDALADWKKTLALINPRPLGTTIDGPGFGPKFHVRGAPLAVDFKRVACDDSPELELLLGRRDRTVETALRYRAQQVLSFAHRTTYDPSVGRGTGFIWVAPDRGAERYSGPSASEEDFWNDRDSLRVTLLHELGHVFGLTHDHGTDLGVSIMSASFPTDYLQYGREHYVGNGASEFSPSPWVGKARVDSAVVADNGWFEAGRELCARMPANSGREATVLGEAFRPAGRWPERLCLSGVKSEVFGDVDPGTLMVSFFPPGGGKPERRVVTLHHSKFPRRRERALAGTYLAVPDRSAQTGLREHVFARLSSGFHATGTIAHNGLSLGITATTAGIEFLIQDPWTRTGKNPVTNVFLLGARVVSP